jgi:hypothetical protein
VKSYIISRTVDELRNRRYITTTVDAPTMEDALAMDRVLRINDAEIAAGAAMDAVASEPRA